MSRTIGDRLSPASLLICGGPVPDLRRPLSVVEFDPASDRSRDELLRALSSAGGQERTVVLVPPGEAFSLPPSLEGEQALDEMWVTLPLALKMADMQDRLNITANDKPPEWGFSAGKPNRAQRRMMQRRGR